MKLVAFVLLFVLFASCNSPVSPIADGVPYRSFHGVWTSISNSTIQRISFDTTDGTYLELWNYEFDFMREFSGLFLRESNRIAYPRNGYTDYRWYEFGHDTLIIAQDSIFTIPTRLVRTSTTPKAGSWLNLASWTRKRVVSGAPTWNFGLGVSDSGTFLLSYDQTHVMWVDSVVGSFTSIPTSTVKALDAEGSFVWTASDSLVEKRTLPDLSVVQSFSIKSTIEMDGSSYNVTGIAVGAGEIYLAAYIQYEYGTFGRIYVFTKDGIFLQTALLTISTIKDLALLGNRLFAIVGDGNFFELNISSGNAIKTYYVEQDYPSGFFSGIAVYGNRLHLCYEYGTFIELIETVIPPQ